MTGRRRKAFAGRLARLRARGSSLRWLLRAPLRLFALLVAAAPFLLAAQLLWGGSLLSIQHPPPDVSVSPAELANWQHVGLGLPANAAPVVLAYHDVRPHSVDPYVVSPEELDRQLTAFAAAGYHTLTTDQLVSYLHGGATPPRSLYLTFDDGTQGLYEYADSILERNHMTAASFLITGRLGHNQPYYLSWPEIALMAASGRWDFQAHTYDLHSRGEVGPAKAFGSLLTGSSWPTSSRMETVPEHVRRVSQDFTHMFADFANHGLPRPQVFAYPFSESDPSYDRAAVEATAAVIAKDFAVALTNKMSEPTPVSRRSGIAGVVERLEVFGTTDTSTLLAEIGAWTAIPPQVDHPLDDVGRWWDEGTRGVARLGALVGHPDGAVDPGAVYLFAAYAPYGSADWMDYVISTEVHGLRLEGNNANVIVRAGSPAETEVRTSCCSLQVVDVATGAVLAQQRLVAARDRQVRIVVSDGALDVTIDGTVSVHVPAGKGIQFTGGITIASRRGNSDVWPYFANMSIVEEM
jgi:biofilm PGA synthesis lipoprotein PgaB